MARRIIFWMVCAVAVGGWVFQYRQHQQAQRQTWLKLRLLNASLLVANERAEEDARHTARETESLVRRIGSQQLGVRVVEQNKQILRRTAQVVTTLRTLRSCLLHSAPRIEHLSDLAGNESEVAAVLALADSMGPAASAHRQLADYTKYIKQFAPALPPLQARQAKDPALNEALAGAGRAGQFYYGRASLPEALIMLTQQETAVWAYATEALSNQSSKVIYCGVLDKVGARVTAALDTVTAGEKYRASLFLAASQDHRDLHMAVNGKPIAVSLSGEGRVEFTVPAAGAARSVKPAFWMGTIRTPMYGRDSTFHIMVRYFVRYN